MNSIFSRLQILYHSSCSYYDEGCWWFSSLCRSLCSPIQHHCCSSTCRRCNWLSICIYFDIFICCTNLRHVKASDALFISITTSSITSISALYHIPIKFSPVFTISLIPSIFYLTPILVSYSFPLSLFRTSLGYLLIQLTCVLH